MTGLVAQVASYHLTCQGTILVQISLNQLWYNALNGNVCVNVVHDYFSNKIINKYL